MDTVKLREFITSANVSGDSNLPWVHSTASARLFEVLRAGRLLATPCNVFQGEKLCYLFVGRPAYKSPEVANPKAWQLPVVFVVRFHERPPIRRIYPFDSGAFAGKRLPDYLTLFRLDGYEVSNDPANIGRIISFFFKTPTRYLQRKAAALEEVQEQHNLDMRHMEVMALLELYQDNLKAEMDDRAAAIEVQLAQDVHLSRENLIGVVLPSEYLRVPGLRDALGALTLHVESYDHLPLSKNQHYGLIYDAVNRIYRNSGVRI